MSKMVVFEDGTLNRRSYHVRRSTHSGPALGFYETIGVYMAEATGTANNGTPHWMMDIGNEARVIAFSWSCTAIGVGAPLLDLASYNSPTAGSANVGRWIRDSAGAVSTLGLTGNLSGTLTRGALVASRRLARPTDATVGDLFPFMPANRYLGLQITPGSATALNLCCVITLFRGAHINALPAND